MELPVRYEHSHDAKDKVYGITYGIFPGGLKEVTFALQPGVQDVSQKGGGQHCKEPFLPGIEIFGPLVVIILNIIRKKEGTEGKIHGDEEDNKEIDLEAPDGYIF